MRIWIPVPDRDFDVTEVSVPWRLVTRAGHSVVLATERGDAAPAGDPLLLGGSPFRGLEAAAEAKALYREMEQSAEFQSPVSWSEIDPVTFDGLILPGGHAPGMRQYLGSAELQAKIAAFFALGRPVGALCHGVLVLARSKGSDGRSVLAGYKTTCLPKYMERTAYLLTFWKLGRRYRTYEAYTEDEVRANLDNPSQQFQRGPTTLLARSTEASDKGAFVVVDRHYVSGRWPGDAYLFARTFLSLLSR